MADSESEGLVGSEGEWRALRSFDPCPPYQSGPSLGRSEQVALRGHIYGGNIFHGRRPGIQ